MLRPSALLRASLCILCSALCFGVGILAQRLRCFSSFGLRRQTIQQDRLFKYMHAPRELNTSALKGIITMGPDASRRITTAFAYGIGHRQLVLGFKVQSSFDAEPS